MKLTRAYEFLANVQAHKECVPFTRFNGGVGRTAQAKAFGRTQGRWPVKSAKFMLGLLKNAESNALANELTSEDLLIRNIVVNQAPVSEELLVRWSSADIAFRKPADAHTVLTVESTLTKVIHATLRSSSRQRASRSQKQKSPALSSSTVKRAEGDRLPRNAR